MSSGYNCLRLERNLSETEEPGRTAIKGSIRKGSWMGYILDYLEQASALYPDHTAVDDNKISLTWSQLVCAARTLGTEFQRHTQPGRPVAILMEKSSYTLAAMFGAVYAGCFYTVLDPDQPAVRLGKILRVLGTDLVVAYDAQTGLLKEAGYKGEILYPDAALLDEVKCIGTSESRSRIDAERLGQIRAGASQGDILYGIFTSGSTGVPKAVVVSHKAVSDFIAHFVSDFGITGDDRIGNQAPFDFDVSVKDIYSSVLTGAELVLIPKKLFSTPPLLLDYLCEKHVTSLTWAVSALTMISALRGFRYRIPSEVRRVMFSGEVMPARQLRIWQDALPDALFVNLYGPTEITCNCTYYRVERTFEDGEKLPLGQAFEGREVFLLDDEEKQIHESGKTGEICVSGESLSDGYFHNPEETEKHFLVGKDNIRYYKTGDLGYYGGDGELYFSGRRDFQIKHMGHRIELEEIERALDQIGGIEKSCCVMDERKHQLVAFFFGEAQTDQIRREMKEKVPVYMVPNKLLRTERLVLTKNGKTDRDYYRRKLGAES